MIFDNMIEFVSLRDFGRWMSVMAVLWPEQLRSLFCSDPDESQV